MTQIRTHIATLAELEEVASLFDSYRQFYLRPADLVLARGFIRDRMQHDQSVIIVAFADDQKMIGFCQLYPTFCSVEAVSIYSLYDLFVIPSARHTGAGKVLLQAAERHAAQSGMARMDLTTAKSNRVAQSLYESLGWVRDEVFHAYCKRVEI